MLRFQAQTLDFRGRSVFTRYDECEFVKCEILIDDYSEDFSVTNCSFEDCNITELVSVPERAILAEGNIFKLPIETRNADLDRRLTEALAAKL